jgi:hypothetical protein
MTFYRSRDCLRVRDWMIVDRHQNTFVYSALHISSVEEANMFLNRSSRSARSFFVGYIVLALMFFGALPREGWAIILPSDFASSQRTDDLTKLQTFLESKVVRQRLSDLGMPQEEIRMKLAQLSDREIHQLSQHTELLVPGGDALGFVIAVLIVAILVVILLQLTGHRVIITK